MASPSGGRRRSPLRVPGRGRTWSRGFSPLPPPRHSPIGEPASRSGAVSYPPRLPWNDDQDIPEGKPRSYVSRGDECPTGRSTIGESGDFMKDKPRSSFQGRGLQTPRKKSKTGEDESAKEAPKRLSKRDSIDALGKESELQRESSPVSKRARIRLERVFEKENIDISPFQSPRLFASIPATPPSVVSAPSPPKRKKRLSLEKKYKRVMCYTCGMNVREFKFEKHLFFGEIECTKCEAKFKKCEKFNEGVACQMGNEECEHVFKFCRVPSTYLFNNLMDPFETPANDCMVQDKLISYISSLKQLATKDPWKEAISECHRFIDNARQKDNELKHEGMEPDARVLYSLPSSGPNISQQTDGSSTPGDREDPSGSLPSQREEANEAVSVPHSERNEELEREEPPIASPFPEFVIIKKGKEDDMEGPPSVSIVYTSQKDDDIELIEEEEEEHLRHGPPSVALFSIPSVLREEEQDGILGPPSVSSASTSHREESDQREELEDERQGPSSVASFCPSPVNSENVRREEGRDEEQELSSVSIVSTPRQNDEIVLAKEEEHLRREPPSVLIVYNSQEDEDIELIEEEEEEHLRHGPPSVALFSIPSVLREEEQDDLGPPSVSSASISPREEIVKRVKVEDERQGSPSVSLVRTPHGNEEATFIEKGEGLRPPNGREETVLTEEEEYLRQEPPSVLIVYNSQEDEDTELMEEEEDMRRGPPSVALFSIPSVLREEEQDDLGPPSMSPACMSPREEIVKRVEIEDERQGPTSKGPPNGREETVLTEEEEYLRQEPPSVLIVYNSQEDEDTELMEEEEDMRRGPPSVALFSIPSVLREEEQDDLGPPSVSSACMSPREEIVKRVEVENVSNVGREEAVTEEEEYLRQEPLSVDFFSSSPANDEIISTEERRDERQEPPSVASVSASPLNNEHELITKDQNESLGPASSSPVNTSPRDDVVRNGEVEDESQRQPSEPVACNKPVAKRVGRTKRSKAAVSTKSKRRSIRLQTKRRMVAKSKTSGELKHKFLKLRDDHPYLVVREAIEECPMCNTELCPTRFTLNLQTFLLRTECIGCNLSIYIIFTPPDGSAPLVSIITGDPAEDVMKPKCKKRRCK